MRYFKKINAYLLSITILLTSMGMYLEAEGSLTTTDTEIHVAWGKTYSDFDEMIEDVDLIVYGTVVSQIGIVFDDGLVYTKSTVKVEKVHSGNAGNIITILQLGGTVGNNTTSFPEELPLLEKNGKGIFMCVDKEDYYLIAGAGQGVFWNMEQDNWTECLKSCETQFVAYPNNMNLSRAFPETPTTTWYYSPSTEFVGYYLGEFPAGFSSENTAAIINGIDVWDQYIPLTISEVAYEMGNCVTINVTSVSSPVNNVALTTYVNEYFRLMTFYQGTFQEYGYGTSVYGKVAIHEMGHALGLGHSSTTSSVMYPTVSGMASLPSARDIEAIQSLYY